MSARQCALFRRGLALELEYINHHVVQFKVQVRRFQVPPLVSPVTMACISSVGPQSQVSNPKEGGREETREGARERGSEGARERGSERELCL